jgi:hypothetical protein
VSDILPDRQGILDQPKLHVKAVPSSRSGSQHWQVHLDPNGIIGPKGQPIRLSTKVSGETKSSVTVIFDTGFSFNQVPLNVPGLDYSVSSSNTLELSPIRSIHPSLDPSSKISPKLVPSGPYRAMPKSTLPCYSATGRFQSIHLT